MSNAYDGDRLWHNDVSRHIDSHHYVDRSLYVYDYWASGSAFNNGTPRDVGGWPFDVSKVSVI